MREVTGSIWTFQLIVLFILIFACFLTLVINYSKAYTVKNEMMSIIEKYEGFGTKAKKIVNNYLYNNSYNAKGKCNSGEYGATSLDNPSLEQVTNEKEKYYYCVSTEVKGDGKTYYNFKVFFNFNLPIIGDIFTFKITGQTKGITNASGI